MTPRFFIFLAAGAARTVFRILLYHSRTIYSVSETQFYTPPIPEPVKASEGRFIPNRMEDGAVMRRVSRDLYASPASGLREILANEITAARAAKKLGADPRIEVTVLPDRVCVWGIDSLGMERRIFDEVYTVLGRSGNFDGSTPGQFGFGRVAYVTLSDHMLLETRHRNGDRYAVRGIDGAGFETGLPEPDIPYGTRITLVPRNTNGLYALARIAEMAAGRCEIPITIATGNGTERPERRRLHNQYSILHFDHPDVEFAVWPAPSGPAAAQYLCGMPIKFTYRGDHNIHVAVDIRDERKHPPTPDRERMGEDAERAISDIIDAEIRRRLEAFPTDINEALAHPDRALAFDMHIGPPEMRAVVTDFNGGDSEARMLGGVGGSPVLNCRTFSKRRIGAVLERFPEAGFVKGAPPGLAGMSDFMDKHGIAALPPRGGPAGKVPVHTANGSVRVDPESPPEWLEVFRVADGRELVRHRQDLVLLPSERTAALTIHGVRGAVDIGELVAEARSAEFTTSRGTMAGGDIADGGSQIMISARRAIVDNWEAGTPGSGVIMVWDDGGAACGRACGLLAWLAGRHVNRGAYIGAMDCEMVVETYLRLGSPTLRRALSECDELHSAKYCNGFLALEGKPPAAPDADCACSTFQPRTKCL